MNAYSTDFVHNLEALSQSLSEVLARLDQADGTTAALPRELALVPGGASEQRRWARATDDRAALPDPRLVRRIIRQRQLRCALFPG